MSGHVKLNGNFVWRGSWCDNSFPNHRGLNTFLIDPFNCSVDEWRRWDTHDIEVSDIPVTETQTDTEMIDISKTHIETNTEKIFNTDTIYI